MLKLRKELELSLRILGRALTVRTDRTYSKESDGKDGKSQPNDAKVPTEQSAAARLSQLISSMQTESPLAEKHQAALAEPGVGARKRRNEAKEQAANKDIFVAAKRVADLIDDTKASKQTEMELLSKLLQQRAPNAAARDDNSDSDDEKQNDELSLSDLMASMKVERQDKDPHARTRSEFVRHALQNKKRPSAGMPANKERKGQSATYSSSVNLFGAQPLGIFKESTQLRDMPDLLPTWTHLRQHALQLLVAHPPSNYFEKIALWTEHGRVWHFPIDNEQGLEEERKVDFTEHIFLEQHLEPWCPDKGPIRHYMELVCVGLSKNPYITAKEKKEHILWYRDYFENKKELLDELIKASASENKPLTDNEQLQA